MLNFQITPLRLKPGTKQINGNKRKLGRDFGLNDYVFILACSCDKYP